MLDPTTHHALAWVRERREDVTAVVGDGIGNIANVKTPSPYEVLVMFSPLQSHDQALPSPLLETLWLYMWSGADCG